MNITVKQLIIRNTKLYFKDKSTFLTSLITPLVLLVLFVTFLGRVYEESFLSIIPQGVNIPESLVNAFTNGWLLSSLIGVSCITIAFCSNIIMVQDKINGARNDILAAPVKKSVLAVSYFISNYISTLLVCLAVAAVGFIYLGFTGWYFSASDIVFIVLDILLSCLFGASLAALIDGFLSTQGGVGAVSTLVSALYGFICGAYMPISQFSTGVRRFISLLPGTHDIMILRNHYMRGVFAELENSVPAEMINALRDGFDVNMYFFENKVELWQAYAAVGCTIAVALTAYIIVSRLRIKK